MVESNRAAEDSVTKAEEEEGAKSGGEDLETSCGVAGADQSVGYIVHFDNLVRLYQRKNQNCFRCHSPDYLMKDCLKDLSKTAKDGWTPQKPVVTPPESPDKAP